jgi:hypothetical protein
MFLTSGICDAVMAIHCAKPESTWASWSRDDLNVPIRSLGVFSAKISRKAGILG